MSSRESHITNVEKTQPAKEFSKKKINEDLHNKSLTDSVTIRNIVRNKVCLSIFCSERYFKVSKNSLEHCNIEGLLLSFLRRKDHMCHTLSDALVQFCSSERRNACLTFGKFTLMF